MILALTRKLPVVIVFTLLFITIFLWRQAVNTTAQNYKEYFDFRVREATANIQNRMDTYQQVLYGTRGLYEASASVDRSEFREYVFSLRLKENFPGNQGVGFSLIIPPDQKDSHMLAVRKEGFPEYNIRPEGDRDPFTSIVFLEPLADRNLRAFGYDMFSEPVRHEAMERARDTDKAAMSGKVRLVQEYGKVEQAGFLIYIPVYKNNHPHNTLSSRRTNIVGWVYSPFRMNDLMDGIFGERAQDIDVEVYDGSEVSADAIMYDSNPPATTLPHKNQGNDATTLSSSHSIEIAGHTWTVVIKALPSLFTRVNAGKPLLILIVGTGSSFILGWLTWLLITGRERALKAAREMNAQYIESENTLQAILDSSAIGISWANEEGEIEYVNQKFISMFGYTLKDIPTIDQWSLRAYPDTSYRNKIVSEWKSMTESTIQDRSHLPPLEVSINCSDGSTKEVLLLGSWAGTKLLVNFSDITNQKTSEKLAEHMAQHDALTGLPNRALFSDRLEQAIRLAKRENALVAVLFVDLDKFKSINDTFGHDTGDDLLKEVAKRIEECLRESDVVARMGGDEFLVLVQSSKNEESINLVAKKILFVLSNPFFISGNNLEISASIGIAIYPQHGETEAELTKNADLAMYNAKQKGRNGVSLFHSLSKT